MAAVIIKMVFRKPDGVKAEGFSSVGLREHVTIELLIAGMKFWEKAGQMKK